MYTDSLKQETDFLAALLRSHDTKMVDRSETVVCKCPKCQQGFVVTRCIRGCDSGRRYWRFEHYCRACHERFEIGRLRSDIFFHKPFEILNGIETPFGRIQVTVNGATFPFRCRRDCYEESKYSHDKAIKMQIIDIDCSEMKVGDVFFCGFDKDILEHNDSDERSVLYSCENEKQLLGLCAYEPEELDCYCYELRDYTSKGFGYHITANPQEFDVMQFYESRMCSLAVTWLDKQDHKDPNTEMFLALTYVIG